MESRERCSGVVGEIFQYVSLKRAAEALLLGFAAVFSGKVRSVRVWQNTQIRAFSALRPKNRPRRWRATLTVGVETVGAAKTSA